MKDRFLQMGADVVIRARQDMLPSTKDFIEAFQAAKASMLIVFPNSSNILPAAQQAAKLSPSVEVILLDTRTGKEYARGHIEGFRNIPVDELRERLDEIEKGKPVYVICQSGLRSYIASRILEGNGYEAYNFAGGFRYYEVVTSN